MSSHYASRSRLFRDALSDAVAGLDGEDALAAIEGLASRCRVNAGDDANALGALEAFDAIAGRRDLDAALSEAAALFESPQRFREALFFLRCLDRDATATLNLMRTHAYLSGAVMPAALDARLAEEQTALLHSATFEALWLSPESLPSTLAAIDAWRAAYGPLYVAGHAEHVRHMAVLVSDVEAAHWQVDALEKLNRLHRLGEPVAPAALLRFHDIASTIVCGHDAGSLEPVIAQAPVCDVCGFKLGDRGPIDGLNAALVDIERGLGTQRERLARKVLRRLAARSGSTPGDRLRIFIDAVENDNLPALARVLDDGMIDFLEDVLQAPEPRVNLIDRLAEAYPEVTEDSVEAVVSAFRSLVRDELQRSGGRVVIGREDRA
jgi:hypothetical protein